MSGVNSTEEDFPTVSASILTDKGPDSLPISVNEGRDTEHLKSGADMGYFSLAGHSSRVCVSCIVVYHEQKKCSNSFPQKRC